MKNLNISPVKKAIQHFITLGFLLVLISPVLSQRSSVTGSRFKINKKSKRRKPLNYINHIDLTLNLGSASVVGDICDGFNCFKPTLIIGGGAQYRINESLMLRGELNYVRLRGTDVGGKYEYRNLSFVGDNVELSTTLVYDIFEYNKMYRRRHLISPYLFIGAGLLYYSPKAELNGETHRLRPLETEGVKYSSFTFEIPYGLGLRFKMNPHINISTEFGLRYTFTDYLDDVHGSYDESKLDLPDDDISKQLADRRTNLTDPRGVPHEGIRGGNTADDLYYSFSVKLEYTIKVTKQRYNINSNVSRFRIIKSIKKK